MTEPAPVFLGAFQPMYRGDILDRYIDISADLVSAENEHIDAADFSVTLEGAAEETPNVVAANSVTLTSVGRVDFQVTAPATAGTYLLKAVFTISDGQVITKTASFGVV